MLEGANDQNPTGMSEDQTGFGNHHYEWGEKTFPDADTGRPKRMRYNLSESPLTALARRRDKDGKPFLSYDLLCGRTSARGFQIGSNGTSGRSKLGPIPYIGWAWWFCA